MQIVFVVSFIGLLGDATEEFVENLDTQKGKSTFTLFGQFPPTVVFFIESCGGDKIVF